MSTIIPSPIPVFYAKGQDAGHLYADIHLLMEVRGYRHMLGSLWGWAIDTQILEDAENNEVFFVYIIENDTNTHYQAPVCSFWEYGLKIDTGSGEQMCLSLEHWTITEYNS